jgi:hypothetical protein
MSTIIDLLKCHHCDADKSVKFKEIRTKGFVEYKVGKCSECKEHNGLKQILKHNKILE